MDNPPHSLNESELIRRCLRGDEEAWSQLFDTYYEPLYCFVFRQSPYLSAEQVEYLCQETLSAVVQNLRTFRGKSGLKTWIFQIALHRYRDWVDQIQAAKRGSGKMNVSLDQEDPETGLSRQVADPRSVDPAEGLIRSERRAEIVESLEKLGEDCQEIIRLRYFGDLSYEEISEELRLNVKTVSSRLSKCLSKLREIFQQVSVKESET
jgi:RNA polymerase sigma-70 factor (ECF subfamily)